MIYFRLKFAQQANAVGPWIQQKTEEIVGVALEMDGTLEQQIQKLKIYQVFFSKYFSKEPISLSFRFLKRTENLYLGGFRGEGNFCTTWFLTPETP